MLLKFNKFTKKNIFGIFFFVLILNCSTSITGGSGGGGSSQSGSGVTWTPSSLYSYSPESASAARTNVISNAGVDKAGWDAVASPVGFASLNGGTTGGGTTAAVTVTNRAEFISAVSGDTAKVVHVSGVIDLCVDASNTPMSEADFISASGTSYSFAAYIAECTGLTAISTGPEEAARVVCMNKQKAQIVVNIGSNTTIIGLTGAVIKNGNLNISGKSNIIIRNINFQDAYDYFPQWDPTDGSTGNWNSQYDIITLQNSARNIWIDHCEFSDGVRTDNTFPEYFGKRCQHHDGAIDITKQADYVTISYCYIHDHDKTHLVGSSDSSTTDRGKLRITFHHNYYKDISQRVPRVRFGQIHAYNNYYSVSALPLYAQSYVFGVGVEASIYAEANYFESGIKQLAYYDKTAQPGYIKNVNNVPAISGIKY